MIQVDRPIHAIHLIIAKCRCGIHWNKECTNVVHDLTSK